MPSKSPELKATEKRIKEEQKHAQEAARRDRAKAVVDSSKYIGDFRVMYPEAETVLKAAITGIGEEKKYQISVSKDQFERNISDSFPLICEELQQYGAITTYMLLGSSAILTLSDAGKTYFYEKEEAEKKMVDISSNGRNKVFISHRSIDAPIADMIKDFLVNSGIPNENVFCSSLPGNDVNEKIAPEVKQKLKESKINILILSKDYYESSYCLNEAGIAWYLDEAVAIPIGLPEIDHTKMVGFINSDYKLRRLDNDTDISYLYDTAQEKLHTDTVKHSIITRETQKLKEKYKQYLSERDVAKKDEPDIKSHTTTISLGRDEGLLLIYAASDPSGQIMMINPISQSAPSISTGNYDFVSEDTAREGARWKAAIDKLERYGLIEDTNYKRQIFTVTDQGYKVAETAKAEWNIDTEKSPEEYLEK